MKIAYNITDDETNTGKYMHTYMGTNKLKAWLETQKCLQSVFTNLHTKYSRCRKCPEYTPSHE